MNERIKLLAAQARKKPLGTSYYWTNPNEFEQKFAELIVRECIEQVITGPNGPAHYAVEAALRLKKHFGVEDCGGS